MPERWAYVDESLRTGDGLYLMAAVIVENDRLEEYREALLTLLLPRLLRLHWHEERDSRRERLARAVGALGAAGVVMVGARLKPAK